MAGSVPGRQTWSRQGIPSAWAGWAAWATWGEFDVGSTAQTVKVGAVYNCPQSACSFYLSTTVAVSFSNFFLASFFLHLFFSYSFHDFS
jgi:hypothetical protein